jgi:hypothetical protein
VAASHVQSRVVVIANVLDIPLAGAVPALPSMLTWHFELEGAVVEMEDDEPAQAAARTASVGITNCRARTAPLACNQPAEGGTANFLQSCMLCGRKSGSGAQRGKAGNGVANSRAPLCRRVPSISAPTGQTRDSGVRSRLSVTAGHPLGL